MRFEEKNIRLVEERTLSNNWYLLKRYTFDLKRRNGSWQRQTREVYDRGNGATILLYSQRNKTVVLTRQFRLPTYMNGLGDGMLIEAAAGLLDNASPIERIRAEVEEETGYRVENVTKIFEVYMSPGSVTERLFFFIAEYEPGDKHGAGGGLEAEGEDIEVIELPFAQAFGMIDAGEIIDAKTIMLLQYAALHLFRT